MPIYKLSSRERRALKNLRIVAWAKWVAVVLSVALLATTLLLVRARRSLANGTSLPAAVEMRKPLVAR